jgi:spermidine synthase
VFFDYAASSVFYWNGYSFSHQILCEQGGGAVATVSGRVYAWNTLGNVTGALLAGMLLLPYLGMEKVFLYSAVVNVLIAIMLLSIAIGMGEKSRIDKPVISMVAIVIVAILISGKWELRWFTINNARRVGQTLSREHAFKSLKDYKIIYYYDDPAANVVVCLGKSGEYSLFVNGKVDASSQQDMITQVMLGHLPLVMHENPEDVLIVGLASGITAGAALKHDIKSLDVVDIIGSMKAASKYFSQWNFNPLSDQRTRFIVDDAISFMRFDQKKYDVIVSEPSNPWTAGTGNLFSEEFFKFSKSRLKKGGMFLQWFHSYECGNQMTASVIRTFRSVFPYVYGFQGGANDLLLVGYEEEPKFDLDLFESRMKKAEVAAHLKDFGIESLGDLLLFQMFSPSTTNLLSTLSDTVNSLDNHYLEYQAPLDLFMRRNPSLLKTADGRLNGATDLLLSKVKNVSLNSLYRLGTDFRFLTHEMKSVWAQTYWLFRERKECGELLRAKINKNYAHSGLDSLDEITSFLKDYFSKPHLKNRSAFFERISNAILFESMFSLEARIYWAKFLAQLKTKDKSLEQKLLKLTLKLDLLSGKKISLEVAEKLLQDKNNMGWVFYQLFKTKSPAVKPLLKKYHDSMDEKLKEFVLMNIGGKFNSE